MIQLTPVGAVKTALPNFVRTVCGKSTGNATGPKNVDDFEILKLSILLGIS